MPPVAIATSDLAPFAEIPEAKAQAMIDDALAQAALVAPCILTADFAYGAAAKAILRGAILRWNESGSGALAGETAGPFGITVDTRTPRRSLFWPSEIETLQDMCKVVGDDGGAFSVDTIGAYSGIVHAAICSINFGSSGCSCGAIITGSFPLYESIGEVGY